jgi:hypothetical protein
VELVVKVYLDLAYLAKLEVLAVELEVSMVEPILQVVLELLCRDLQAVAQSPQVVAAVAVVELELLAEAQTLAVTQLQEAVVLDWLHLLLESV